jgi:monoamine oxidase
MLVTISHACRIEDARRPQLDRRPEENENAPLPTHVGRPVPQNVPMDPTISRRGLLAGAGATAVAVAAPAVATARSRRHIEVDVAIVGAGLTGLNAARTLQRAGRSVHVLEADTRVGGRVWTVKAHDGTPVNWGATFIGPQQTAILALARRLGVRTYPTYNTGDNVLLFDGRRATYTGAVPPVDPGALVEVAGAIADLNRMATGIDPAKPYAAPGAAEWDRQTFYTWSRANFTSPATHKLLDLAVLSIFSVESWETSLLQVLWYIRCAGSLDNLINTAGGAQERQLSGGAQQVPIRLARQIGAHHISLDAPVRRIVTAHGRCTVHADGVTVVARRVIVAVPPPMIPRIAFEPGLSALKDQACQHQAMGSVGKAVGIYATPFWRAKGLTGQATSDAGPTKITFDISPGDGSPGVMMGFIDGQDARDWAPLPAAQRRRRVLDQWATFFGEEARSPKQFLDVSWDGLVWHRGCPIAVPSTGAITGFRDALRRPEGAIHFASTETATAWAGYMDGAVRAGVAVAGDVRRGL